MVYVIAALLFVTAAASVTCAAVLVLLYARLRGVDMAKMMAEVNWLWRKKKASGPRRPVGV
jgi:hypothetical protein